MYTDFTYQFLLKFSNLLNSQAHVKITKIDIKTNHGIWCNRYLMQKFTKSTKNDEKALKNLENRRKKALKNLEKNLEKP